MTQYEVMKLAVSSDADFAGASENEGKGEGNIRLDVTCTLDEMDVKDDLTRLTPGSDNEYHDVQGRGGRGGPGFWILLNLTWALVIFEFLILGAID